MFRQNDYIVCLEGDFTTNIKISNVAKLNYCVRQIEDKESLSVDILINGDKYDRSNASFKFDKSGKLKDWRYATEQEIEHYNKIGKPYDVTTLPPEMKVLVEEDHTELIKLLKNL